jgi:hypothetical protein
LKDITHIKEDQRILLQKYICELKIKAEGNTQILFSDQMKEITTDLGEEEKIKVFTSIFQLIDHLFLFPDDKIIKRLRQLKVGQAILKWFIPADLIIYELEKLENHEEVFPLSYYGFRMIEIYLSQNINYELLSYFGYTIVYRDNKESTLIEQKIINRIRSTKRKRTKECLSLESFDDYINQVYDLAIENLSSFDERSISDVHKVNQFVNGKTSSFLKIFKGLFDSDQLSERKYYCLLFPLFKLIVKNKKFHNEDEFQIKHSIKYEGDYNSYKSSRVKKMVG